MSKNKKILHLSLKEIWFRMIISGVKKEEYREINDYWKRRLVVSEEYNLLDDEVEYVEFDYIEFTLGYPKSDDKERRAIFKFEGIKRSTGRAEWGAEPRKEYYVIQIGERVS